MAGRIMVGSFLIVSGFFAYEWFLVVTGHAR